MLQGEMWSTERFNKCKRKKKKKVLNWIIKYVNIKQQPQHWKTERALKISKSQFY